MSCLTTSKPIVLIQEQMQGVARLVIIQNLSKQTSERKRMIQERQDQLEDGNSWTEVRRIRHDAQEFQE